MKYLIYLFSFLLLFGCKVKKVSDYSGVNYSVTDTSFSSTDLDSMISPYKIEM